MDQPTENNRLIENKFLSVGLHIAGCKNKKLSRRTQVRRFREMHGCHPKVVRLVWLDLKDKVPKGAKLDCLFWALFFLRRHPLEVDLASRVGKDPAAVRKWVWTIIFGLQELKAEKIKFPEDGFQLTFIMSVDGTDCPIEEPRPFSKSWFSQKFKGPGVKHEVALDVLTGECVWIKGPCKASQSDITICRSGLKHSVPDGKLVVADKAHRGEPDTISPPNHLDDEEVAALKKRIRARQETFFSRMKAFKILKEPFRHKPVLPKHKACFEAVAVLAQCGIVNGFPLFHI